MPQNQHIELYQKRCKTRMLEYFDLCFRKTKKLKREFHEKAHRAQTRLGIEGKICTRTYRSDKIQLRRSNVAVDRLYEEKTRQTMTSESVPSYLLERKQAELFNHSSKGIRLKRIEKFEKWMLPLPKVRLLAEENLLKVYKSGKRGKKSWKRIVTKVTFQRPNFTRAPPKYERFILPKGLRMTKANVTHIEQKTTVHLCIIGVKKNPNGRVYSSLGIITKGTIIEVDVTRLGLSNFHRKIIFSKYAQVMNCPENDGTINAVFVN